LQNEASVAHIPCSSQNAEQQSLLPSQLLPNVLQVELSATQVLSSPQSPPQHSPSLPQLSPSDTHWPLLQVPSTQAPEQHSGPTLHGPVAAVHAPASMEHTSRSGSQYWVQQSVPAAQAAPPSAQTGLPPDPPPPPIMPPVPLKDSPVELSLQAPKANTKPNVSDITKIR
jgi:hypothetical protein